MKCTNCEILDADGVHEDGWCGPKVRLRIGTRTSALSLRLTVWIPDSSAKDAEFKVRLGPKRLFQRSHRFRVPSGQPTPLMIPIDVRSGDEVSLTTTTGHRVKKSNEEKRDLSFVLQEVAVGRSPPEKSPTGGSPPPLRVAR